VRMSSLSSHTRERATPGAAAAVGAAAAPLPAVGPLRASTASSDLYYNFSPPLSIKRCTYKYISEGELLELLPSAGGKERLEQLSEGRRRAIG